jgi:hypothetical protein
MRTLAAILLISVAGCSAESYSLRAPSSTALVAVNDSPSVGESSTGPRRVIYVLGPEKRGHSAAWKTGAIITFTSIGVSLMGAALTVGGLGNPDSGYGSDAGLFISGLVISAVGDAGTFIAGPITWMAGIGRQPD